MLAAGSSADVRPERVLAWVGWDRRGGGFGCKQLCRVCCLRKTGTRPRVQYKLCGSTNMNRE